MREGSSGIWTPAVNLVLPGGGLILRGAIGSGLALGLAFAGAANLALVAVLLFPDDFSAVARLLCIGSAAGCYVWAQVRMRRVLVDQRRRHLERVRLDALRKTAACVDRGDLAGAVTAIRAIEHLARTDLSIAYRLALTLSQAGEIPEALAAWRQVRKLDRHGIYRAAMIEHERRLGQAGMP